MNRRTFLKTNTLALAATGAATLIPEMAGSLTARRRSSRAIKLAVKFGMVAGPGSVREKFSLLKELGYDGVELDAPSNLDKNEVREAIESTGLPVHGVVDSVHWSKPFSHPDPAVRAEGVKALEIAIQDCRAYGGDTVLVVPAVVNKQVSYADAYERSQREIRRVLPLAKELGIRIAFENVWNKFLLSPLEAARYVDEFEHPDVVGWYFDVGVEIHHPSDIIIRNSIDRPRPSAGLGTRASRRPRAGSKAGVEPVGRAGARHAPGSVPLADPFHRLLSWQAEIECPLRLLRRSARLSGARRDVFAARHGLAGEAPMTVEEVMERFGMSHRRIDRLLREAASMLRRSDDAVT